MRFVQAQTPLARPSPAQIRFLKCHTHSYIVFNLKTKSKTMNKLFLDTDSPIFLIIMLAMWFTKQVDVCIIFIFLPLLLYIGSFHFYKISIKPSFHF